MPIEIRELVIRARVDPEGERRAGAVAAGPQGGAAAPQQGGEPGADLVQTCVQEVLRILEEKRER